MTPTEFQKQLQVLREDGAGLLERNWKKAADYIGTSMKRGVDITPAIGLLKATFQKSRQVPTMEAIAAVLVAYYLQTNDLSELYPLIHTATYGNTVILEALLRHAGRREDFSKMLPLLLDGMSSAEFEVFRILQRHIGRDSKRLGRIVNLMADSETSRRFVPVFIRESIISGHHKNVDFSVVMPVLAAQLAYKDLREAAAGVFFWIVNAGIDIAGVATMLEHHLSDRRGQVRAGLAYALTFSRIATADWPHLDALLASPDETTRASALRAVGAALISGQHQEREVMSRMALGLLEDAPAIRDSVREVLGKAKSLCDTMPDAPVLERLVLSLADENKGEAIMEYLYYVAERSAGKARQVDALLSSMPDSDRVARLRSICRDVESNRHSISCNICKYLPRHAYYTSPSDVPKHFSSLVPYEPVDRSIDRTCPECGRYYAYSYSQEWQSPSEGFGIDYEIHLDRLTPPEMRKRLQGEALEEYLQTYDQQLARCRSNLKSPEKYLREDAARALVLHSIDQLDWPDCARLLADQDAAVRQTALETLHEEWRKDQPQKRITPLVDTLVKLLDDPAPVARSQAAEMLAAHYALEHDAANLLTQLDRDDPFIKAEMINAVRSHPDVDPSPFLAPTKLLLRHDSGKVRYHAAQFLVGLAKKGVDSTATINTFAQLLSSKNTDLRKEAADALRELNWTESTDAAVVLDELIETLSVDWARLFAYEALQKAARRGFNIARAFPRLLEVAANTADTSPYRAEALRTIKLGLPAALQQKEEIDAVTDLLARLLSDPAEGIRRGATECFEPLIQHGGDLSRVLPVIMTMLTKSKVSYIEVHFAEHVASYLLSHRDWPALDRLLAADKEVSGIASRVLGKGASRGKDISPVVESLLQCLTTSSCNSRDGAAYALAELAFRNPSVATTIRERLRTITLDPESAEMKRLARAVK